MFVIRTVELSNFPYAFLHRRMAKGCSIFHMAIQYVSVRC